MRKSPWTPPRRTFSLVAASAAVLVLTVLGAGVVSSTYAARDRFAATAAIRNTQLFVDEPATARARPLSISVAGRSAHVILAEPLSRDARPPFGVDRWPEKGTFLLSSDLVRYRDEIAARFGRYAGELPGDSLPSARSRTVFARPSEPLGEGDRASGFGVTGPMRQVAMQTSGFYVNEPITEPVAFAGVLLVSVIPAGILFFSALAGSVRRTASLTRMLEVVGVTPGRLHRIVLRAHVPALVTGVGIAVGVLGVCFVSDVPLPFADFTVRSVDVRGSIRPYLVALLVGVLCCIGTAVVALRPRRLVAANRPRGRTAWRGRTWLAVAGAIIVFTLSQVALSETVAQAAAGVQGDAILWVMGGSLVAVALMPVLTSCSLAGVARGVSAAGRRYGRAVGIIVGRELEGSLRAARVTAASATLIVVTGLAATWAMFGALPAVQAQKVIDQIDGRYVEVPYPQSAGTDAWEVLAHLPEGTGVLTVTEEAHIVGGALGPANVTFGGDAETLAHWNLRAGEVTTAEALPELLATLVRNSSETRVVITDTPVLAASGDAMSGYSLTTFVVYAEDGGRVDRLAIQRALSEAGGLAWAVNTGGESWVVGANDLAYQFRWVSWLGALAAILLVSALWLRVVDDQRDQVRAVTPLDALFAPRTVLPLVVAVRTSVIAAVVLAVGGGSAALFARVTSGDLTTIGGSMPIVVSVSFAVAVTLGLLSAPVAVSFARVARAWKPGGTVEDA